MKSKMFSFMRNGLTLVVPSITSTQTRVLSVSHAIEHGRFHYGSNVHVVRSSKVHEGGSLWFFDFDSSGVI